MPDPISSSSPNACFPPPPEEEPLMSLNPDAVGGQSEAAQPAAVPAEAPAPRARPQVAESPANPAGSGSGSLVSGSKTLVDGLVKASLDVSIANYASAGPGNFGGQVSQSTATLTLDDQTRGTKTSVTFTRNVAELNVGSNNADGSHGAHIKAQLSAYTLEGTTGSAGFQLTAGVDLGIGLEASSGTRDADGDGRTEYCFKAGSTFAGGICVEPRQLVDDAKAALDTVERLVSSQRRPGIYPL
jgi:hypothetical protein